MEFEMIDEIETEVKLFKYLNIKSLFGAAAGVFLALVLRGMVFEPLVIPFMIFNGLIGFVMLLNSPVNKDKKIYHSLLFYIKRLFDRDKVYHKVEVEPYKDDLIDEHLLMYKPLESE